MDFLIKVKGFCILRSVTRIELLKRLIAVETGACIFGDAATFINKDWKYFYCAPLGSSLGIFDSNVQPGVGKFGCI